MVKHIITNILVLIGALLYNFVFWEEEMGLNTLIFTLFIMGSLWYLNRDRFESRPVQIMAVGTLLLSCLVVWNSSIIARFIYILSLITCAGLIQQREIRFLVFAFFVGLANFFETPLHFFRNLNTLPILRGRKGLSQGAKLAIIPLLILPIFYGIYYNANPKFASLADNFWNYAFKWLSFDWNFGRLIFFLIGLGAVGMALWQHTRKFILNIDNEQKMTLETPEYQEESPLNLLGMDEKTSYQSATLLVVLLNILLFFNNILDLTYVWFNNTEGKTAVELKQYVHEGTYLLIFGIVLAIAVIMFLFKGKLNFLENNKILRGASYVWIAQNTFLALSVGMRNWQYIDHYGLAYKRIGVFIFLILVLYGLWLMYQKIKDKRTIFFFFVRGAWAIYAVMISTCLINWDIFITRYNITVENKSKSIDVPFLLREISDKNISLLYENRAKLIEKMPNKPFEQERYWEGNQPSFDNDSLKIAYFDNQLLKKKEHFLKKISQLSFLSWNYPDHVTKQYLQK